MKERIKQWRLVCANSEFGRTLVLLPQVNQKCTSLSLSPLLFNSSILRDLPSRYSMLVTLFLLHQEGFVSTFATPLAAPSIQSEVLVPPLDRKLSLLHHQFRIKRSAKTKYQIETKTWFMDKLHKIRFRSVCLSVREKGSFDDLLLSSALLRFSFSLRILWSSSFVGLMVSRSVGSLEAIPLDGIFFLCLNLCESSPDQHLLPLEKVLVTCRWTVSYCLHCNSCVTYRSNGTCITRENGYRYQRAIGKRDGLSSGKSCIMWVHLQKLFAPERFFCFTCFRHLRGLMVITVKKFTASHVVDGEMLLTNLMSKRWVESSRTNR